LATASAVLILRDVLDFPPSEVAAMLDTTQQSVNSALKRARATLARELPSAGQEPPPAPGSAVEQALVARLVEAFEAADVDGIVALMTEDAWLRMPPVPLEYQGRELAGEFFATVAFRRGRRYRLVPTRANGQPAVAVYLRDPVNGVARRSGCSRSPWPATGSARSRASTALACPPSGSRAPSPTEPATERFAQRQQAEQCAAPASGPGSTPRSPPGTSPCHER
jgi:Sigma-70, region 4/SnoaL-like domain